MRYSKPVFILPAVVLICFLSINDTAISVRPAMFEFLKSGVTTGYETNNMLLCTPEFIERPGQLSREYIHDEYSKQDPHQGFNLIPIPDSFASRYIKDVPGDTVMVLWSGGKFKAIIDDIVDYMGVCYSELVCVLEPITEIKNRPKRFSDFIVLRKEKFYDGLVIPYIEYQVDDPSYLAIVDSLRREMTRTWQAEDSMRFELSLARTPEDRKEQYIANRKKLAAEADYPFYDIGFHPYGIESEEVPDTLFLMVVGDLSFATEFSWVAQLQLTRVDGIWKTRTMSDPETGSYKNIIRFAIDLNGDGILEYFINSSIYILYNGVFAVAMHGGHPGC